MTEHQAALQRLAMDYERKLAERAVALRVAEDAAAEANEALDEIRESMQRLFDELTRYRKVARKLQLRLDKLL